jgi:hypothetical protein
MCRALARHGGVPARPIGLLMLERPPMTQAPTLFARLVQELTQSAWPSAPMLAELPFGGDIAGLVNPERDPKENKDTPGHVRAVVQKAMLINREGIGALVAT